MKDGEPNKREIKAKEKAIRRRAELVNKSIEFWETRMEAAFLKLEKYDFLEDDPFSEEALEITDEQQEELNEIYQEIEFLNNRCNLELINTQKIEKEINDFINEYGE
tara:strand:+ start:838 stop:1158 length:321 start_codon:yes stop_codon:yes gene_type:complete